MRPDTDSYFIDMAKLVATRSTCIRRSVGCVLVNSRNHVLATGYNGVPAGNPHCNDVVITAGRVEYPHACEGASSPSGTNLDACSAVHAEQNAILQCTDAYAIAKAYVTTFPCGSCAKLLLNTSCREIIYLGEYADTSGMRLWLASGRIARQFSGGDTILDEWLAAMTEWRAAMANMQAWMAAIHNGRSK